MNYRLPTTEEFYAKTIFTCQDCIYSEIIIADKTSITRCNMHQRQVDVNGTCDNVQPIKIN